MSSIASTSNVTAARVREGLVSSKRDIWGIVFQVILLLSLLASLVVLLVLLADVTSKAFPVYAERGIDFLTSPLSSNPDKAGIVQGIVGTAILAAVVAAVAFPFGLMTAIYLEEYAPDTRLTRFIQVNIRNLAGVPSVVYGLLGLSVFVTLIEALRAVPIAIREAGYGVGASRWEVTRQLVLPAATPGVLTGTVLALSRALGETAPLLLAGAVLGSFSGITIERVFTGSYTALPVIVYDWSRRPQEGFRADAAAAIVALLVITLFANAIAIYFRN